MCKSVYVFSPFLTNLAKLINSYINSHFSMLKHTNDPVPVKTSITVRLVILWSCGWLRAGNQLQKCRWISWLLGSHVVWHLNLYFYPWGKTALVMSMKKCWGTKFKSAVSFLTFFFQLQFTLPVHQSEVMRWPSVYIHHCQEKNFITELEMSPSSL